MKIERVLRSLLERRQFELASAGVVVSEGPFDPRIRVEAPEGLEEAVGHLLDQALRALGSRSERRLGLAARPAGAGAVVDLEVSLGDVSGCRPVEIFDAFHSGEDEAALGLVRCRALLAPSGSSVYIGSAPRNSIRFVIEIPPAPARPGAKAVARTDASKL